MIIENTIKFGHGTIVVGADRYSRTLTLEHTEPPIAVGSKVYPEDYDKLAKHEKLYFQYKQDMRVLMDDLKKVSAENPIIEFRGYIFDFTKFNPESVRVLEEKLLLAIMGNTLALAC